MLFKNSEIKTKNIADCYVQTNDGEVVIVVNICLTAINNEIIMIGYKFKTVMDLYTKPLKSSKLNIFIVNNVAIRPVLPLVVARAVVPTLVSFIFCIFLNKLFTRFGVFTLTTFKHSR